MVPFFAHQGMVRGYSNDDTLQQILASSRFSCLFSTLSRSLFLSDTRNPRCFRTKKPMEPLPTAQGPLLDPTEAVSPVSWSWRSPNTTESTLLLWLPSWPNKQQRRRTEWHQLEQVKHLLWSGYILVRSRNFRIIFRLLLSSFLWFLSRRGLRDCEPAQEEGN